MSGIVLDTSAIMAYLRAEPVANRLARAMIAADALSLSAASLVEAGIVAERLQGAAGSRELDRLIERLNIQIMPVTVDHAALAREAFRRYGKSRHRAALNFGDCFSYALASALGQPLLFVGNDFAQTDIAVAPY